MPISSPFRGVLPPSGPPIRAASGRATHFLAPGQRGCSTVPLATVLPPPAPHRRPSAPAGSSYEPTLPRWLLPDADTRIGKEPTGPDLDERPLYIKYVTEPGDFYGQNNLFPSTRRRSSVDRSLVAKALNPRSPSGSRSGSRGPVQSLGFPIGRTSTVFSVFFLMKRKQSHSVGDRPSLHCP